MIKLLHHALYCVTRTMPWMRIAASAISVLGALPAHATAGAEHRITWAIFDLPPVYIVHGEPSVKNLGPGVADRLLAMVIRSLPQYQHTLVEMSLARVLLQMRTGDPVCALNVQRSPERDAVSYSTPLLLAPALTAVMRDDVLKAHPAWRSGVSLHELVRIASLHGLYQRKRSYGATLDAIIAAPDNVGMKPNDGATGLGLIEMTALGRADYTIEYPAMVPYLSRDSKLAKHLASVPLTESASFLEGYVLCTRSPWGMKVTRRIDAVLRHLAANPAYRQALYRWLPIDELARDRKTMDAFFAKRASKRYCTPDCP